MELNHFLTNVLVLLYSLKTNSVPVSVHFSHKRETHQSGTYSDHISDFAMDGDLETCSHAGFGLSRGDKAWWRVRLDGVYRITGVVLAWNSNETNTELKRDFNVLVSTNKNDAGSLVCASGNPRIPEEIDSLNLTCPNPFHGRFVTIKRSGDVIPNELILCEVYIYANLPSGHNQMYLFTNQIGPLFKESSRLAVDGDPNTCSKVRGSIHELPWWYVKLDDTYDITGINIFYGADSSDSPDLNRWVAFVSGDLQDLEQKRCGSLTNDVDGDSRAKFRCSGFGSIVTVKVRDAGSMVLCEVDVTIKGKARDCTNGSVLCRSRWNCVPSHKVCDRIKDCPDGSDEINCTCLPYQYKCRRGVCINKAWLCDGARDCPLGDDEGVDSCASCGRSEFKCFKNNLCIRKEQRCDGLIDCPDSSDEKGCLSLGSKGQEKNLLKATFEGESDFFICSTNWLMYYSLRVCQEMGFKIIDGIEHKKINATKILELISNTEANRDMSIMHSFTRSSKCESEEFVVLFCSSLPRYECGTRGLPEKHLGPYIFNGDVAKLGAWPWHVQIVVNNEVVCGGSILKEDAVLTAAHCLSKVKQLSDIYVKVGTVLRNDPKVRKYPVSRLILHPYYELNGLLDDIAIIKLSDLFCYNNYVRPICLPTSNLVPKEVKSYRYCVMSGFGLTKHGIRPRYLTQGRMDVGSIEECIESYNRSLSTYESGRYRFGNKFHFCIGPFPTKFGIIPCSGDSGSPLVCKNEHGKWMQVGIHKGHLNRGKETCTNAYMTSVALYLEFIKAHLFDDSSVPVRRSSLIKCD